MSSKTSLFSGITTFNEFFISSGKIFARKSYPFVEKIVAVNWKILEQFAFRKSVMEGLSRNTLDEKNCEFKVGREFCTVSMMIFKSLPSIVVLIVPEKTSDVKKHFLGNQYTFIRGYMQEDRSHLPSSVSTCSTQTKYTLKEQVKQI